LINENSLPINRPLNIIDGKQTKSMIYSKVKSIDEYEFWSCKNIAKANPRPKYMNRSFLWRLESLLVTSQIIVLK
jgi:hypothetical protein